MNPVYDKVLEILWETAEQEKLPFPPRKPKQEKLPYTGPARRGKGPKRRSIKRGGTDRRLAFKLISKDTAEAKKVAQERDAPLSPTEIRDLTAPVQKHFPWKKKR